MPFILYLSLTITMANKTTLKERRAVAQRLRDQFKNAFNCSVKIDYLEIQSQFKLHVCALGESRDYLEQLMVCMHEKSESLCEEAIQSEYDIEAWPL